LKAKRKNIRVTNLSKGKWRPSKEYLKAAVENLLVVILYLVLVFGPLFYCFYDPNILPFVGLIYEVIGLHFLYIDEKYKLKRNDTKYSSYYSSLFFIFNSHKNLKSNFKLWRDLRDIEKGKARFSDCKVDLEISATRINHNYDKIDDEEERRKEQMKSMESDLMNLAHFSFLRKAGYFLLGFGFICHFFCIV